MEPGDHFKIKLPDLMMQATYHIITNDEYFISYFPMDGQNEPHEACPSHHPVISKRVISFSSNNHMIINRDV